MIVRHLSLTDFRNYEQVDVVLHPGSNVFVGSNGQGKTNLVESLGYLSILGSHRVSTEQALIRQGRESAIIRARVAHHDREMLVEVQLNRSGANRAQVNRSVVKTRDVPRFFSSVLFAPEDLALVRGEPGVRRRFLDDLLVLRSPRLSAVLADYDRVLRQRNALLKSARSVRGELHTLDVWDDRMTALGTEIIRARLSLAADLEPQAALAYRAIAGGEHEVSLSMQLSVLDPANEDIEEGATTPGGTDPDNEAITRAFRESLSRLRRAELDRGVSLVGPHRDDLILTLNGMAARSHASHGESWSFALALKLASAHVLRKESQTGDPVLVLDDVFAELDELRRGRLASAISDFEQVLITAAVLGDVPPELTTTVVTIAAGRVVDA